MPETRVSILGFGTVGRALAQRLATEPCGVRVVSLTDRHGTLEDRRGIDLAAALAEKTARGSIARSSHDAAWAVERVDADVVIDLLPTDLRTGEPSLGLALAALRRGKHVVAASKGAIALHGPTLAQAAALAGREVRTSASVLGGTPALELLRGAFRGDRVERFDAVLNGSTNVVLSLLEEGETWDAALAQARAQGILEADPSLDLLGLDAAAKAVILANAAWGARWTLADVDARGIVGITPREAREAKANGLALRLVARASPERGIHVAPVALPRDHALVTEGTENALRLKLAGAGVVTLRGPGAGGAETAAAVLSDVLSLERVYPGAAPMLAA